MSDIALGAGGKLSGRVVDQSGQAVEGATVTLLEEGRELRRTVTDKAGKYSFDNLRGGIYTIASGTTEGVVRAWADKTAPPIAKQHAMLVVGANGVRGQIGTLAVTQGLAAAGAIPVIAAGTLNSSYSAPVSPGSTATASNSMNNRIVARPSYTGGQSLVYDPSKDPSNKIIPDPLPDLHPIPVSP